MSDSVKIKPYFKSELARLYGVSIGTFGKWIKMHQTEMEKLGYKKGDRILKIPVVELLFNKLGDPT
ncbi:MAG: hypothetical protein AAFQ94_09170 [Bacteroidota bacterium]